MRNVPEHVYLCENVCVIRQSRLPIYNQSSINEIVMECVTKTDLSFVSWCVYSISLLLFRSLSYLLAVRIECAGNELRHSDIMTTFHLIPSTPCFGR